MLGNHRRSEMLLPFVWLDQNVNLHTAITFMHYTYESTHLLYTIYINNTVLKYIMLTIIDVVAT